MKRLNMIWLPVLVLGLLAGWLSSSSQGEEENAKKVDPSGTWTWERTFNGNTRKFVLRLQMEGDQVTGTYKGRDEVKVTDAKMEGDEVSFVYKREAGDRRFVVQYQGKVSEDTIKGTIEFSSDRGDREFEWEAKRSTELSDVLGKWQFKIELPNGNVLETSITLTKKGDKLQGAYVGPRDDEREATNIKVENNKLTFELSGGNDGNSFQAVYTGKPRGDSIKGTIEFDFNGNTGTLEFEVKRQREKAKEA